ncbi:MAG: hypothetical protein ACOC4M_07340 [Promethearchaeia archaeon]
MPKPIYRVPTSFCSFYILFVVASVTFPLVGYKSGYFYNKYILLRCDHQGPGVDIVFDMG